jgi:hypothetical protein
VIVAAFGLLAWHFTYGSLPFDRARWDRMDDWADKTRHRMADGLLQSGHLIGKSHAEITDLLDEPPPTSYFKEFDLVYQLGQDRGWIALDSQWLVMRLGADGKVGEAGLVTD